MEDPVVYMERSNSKLLMIKDLESENEYYPCDRNDESGVYIREYDYYFTRRDKDICAFVEEIATPKYWDHDYISPKLYIASIKKAAAKHSKVVEVLGDSEEPEMMRVVFAIVVCEGYAGKETVDTVIEQIDGVIDEIRTEAEIIAKRELLKYINNK
ncbi:hypothetical protein [Heyndrickxia sporothermodurans]|jgi:hypothetical protein|uniref:hypothetical protein n=1 Tax=Heyndrickxia sporothermodurans TaxID=46224 RepID=UPI000D395694|nr:hypothetical protein [Heyndrickxia sporothermodurans]PTY93066.1 hypothetical protein B5V90_02990 [Heyndrickxia sporothermodurans]